MNNSAALSSMIWLTRRELLRTLRQPARVVATVGTPLVIWLLFASGLGAVVGSGMDGSGMNYSMFLVPGILGLIVIFASIFGAVSLIEDRSSGLLRSVLVSPTPRWAIVGSKLTSSVLIAAIQAAVLLPLAGVMGASFTPVSVLQALALLTMLAAGVAGLSLAAAWRIGTVSGFHGVMNLVLMPAWMLSGAFFPAAEASPWLRSLASINPLTWTLDGLRRSIAGEPIGEGPWTVSIMLAGLGILAGWLTMGTQNSGDFR